MAEVIIEKNVRTKLRKHLINAGEEFGQNTLEKWLEQIEYHKESLKKFPTSYTPIRELRDEEVIYRGCTVMKNFKLIYFYDEARDTVFIKDVWDMRRNPTNLVKDFKSAIMKKLFSIIVLIAISAATWAQSWPMPTLEAKPGTRWWWLGSAVDRENLQWNL